MIADILSLIVNAPAESDALAESAPEPETVESSEPEPASEPQAAGKLVEKDYLLFQDNEKLNLWSKLFHAPARTL